MSYYSDTIRNLRHEAVTAAEKNGNKYLLGQVYSEQYTNWQEKTLYASYPDTASAIATAEDLTANIDWSRTEWYRDEDAGANVEAGDPACTRAMDELAKSGHISLGDYDLILDTVTF